MNKVIALIFGRSKPNFRRKNDGEQDYNREVAIKNWYGEREVKVLKFTRSYEETGEYGSWRALCRSRRELFSLKNRDLWW